MTTEMQGKVDHSGRSLLSVFLRCPSTSDFTAVEVWVDTGFTGDLVLPRSYIEKLRLIESGSVDAVLADGSQIELDTYTCLVEWFGTERKLEVIANEGKFPLLGVGLLLGLEFRVNYHSLALSLLKGNQRGAAT